MMLYPAIGDLEKVTHSRYALVIITAKRARQLLDQSENNGIILNDKPVKMAINDIAAGRIICKVDRFADVDDLPEEVQIVQPIMI